MDPRFGAGQYRSRTDYQSMRTCRLFSICLWLAAPWLARAQVVRTVGPAAGPGVDFTSIQAAIDASADGDVVLVRQGTYPAGSSDWTVDAKSLTLCADAGAPPVFAGGSQGTITHVDAWQWVTVRGFSAPKSLTLKIVQDFGPVWIEDCSIETQIDSTKTGTGMASPPALNIQAASSVVVQRCNIRGGQADGGWFATVGALHLNAFARAYVFDCTISGLPGITESGSACGAPFFPLGSAGSSAAVVHNSSFLHASGVTFQAGDSGACNDGLACVPYDGPPGIALDTGSELSLLQCTVQGGLGGPCSQPGPAGVDVGPAVDAQVVGSVTLLAGQARHLVTASPKHAGDVAALVLQGEPGDLAFLGLSLAPASFYFPSLFVPIVLHQPISVFSMGAVNASGVASKTFLLPVPSVSGSAIVSYFQGAVFTSSAEIRVTPATMLVTLEAGI